MRSKSNSHRRLSGYTENVAHNNQQSKFSSTFEREEGSPKPNQMASTYSKDKLQMQIARELQDKTDRVTSNIFKHKIDCRSEQNIAYQKKLWALLDPLSFLVGGEDTPAFDSQEVASDIPGLLSASNQTYCREQVHKLGHHQNDFQVATHICYNDKEPVCSECAKAHQRLKGHQVLSTHFVINKCRSVLNLMAKQVLSLLKANQDSIRYIATRQREQDRKQAEYERQLEEHFEQTVNSLRAQKEAAAMAHKMTLDREYGNLQSELQTLQRQREEKDQQCEKIQSLIKSFTQPKNSFDLVKKTSQIGQLFHRFESLQMESEQNTKILNYNKSFDASKAEKQTY